MYSIDVKNTHILLYEDNNLVLEVPLRQTQPDNFFEVMTGGGENFKLLSSIWHSNTKELFRLGFVSSFSPIRGEGSNGVYSYQVVATGDSFFWMDLEDDSKINEMWTKIKYDKLSDVEWDKLVKEYTLQE